MLAKSKVFLQSDKQKRRSKIHLAAKLRKAGPHDDKRQKRKKPLAPTCETCADRTYILVDPSYNEYGACPDCWGD